MRIYIEKLIRGMETIITTQTGSGSFAFITRETEGNNNLIGHKYPLTNHPKAITNTDALCQTSVHYLLGRNPIPKGTELELVNFRRNFYRCYFQVNYNGKEYDIKCTDVDIIL